MLEETAAFDLKDLASSLKFEAENLLEIFVFSRLILRARTPHSFKLKSPSSTCLQTKEDRSILFLATLNCYHHIQSQQTLKMRFSMTQQNQTYLYILTCIHSINWPTLQLAYTDVGEWKQNLS